MVAVPMDARRWHEAGQAVEQFERTEAKLMATVHLGLGEAIHQASVRRAERLKSGGRVEPLQGERPSGTVADEPLQTRSVLALDPERCGLITDTLLTLLVLPSIYPWFARVPPDPSVVSGQ